MISVEIKRILKHRYFIFCYIFVLFIMAIAFFMLSNMAIKDAKIPIAIIDYDKSEFSKKYIKRVEKSDLIMVVKTKEPKKLLNKGVINAVVEIPKDFFVKFNSKIKFTSKSDDIVSPAIVDKLFEDFVLDLGKYRLKQKITKNMGDKYVKDALIEYDKLQSDNQFELDIENHIKGSIKGVTGEYKANLISNTKNYIMYSFIFISIIIIINLNMISILRSKYVKRISLSTVGAFKYFLISDFVSIIFVSLPIIVVNLLSFILLSLSFNSFLYLCVVSLVIMLFLFFVIQLIFVSLDNDYYSFGSSMFIIMILAIVGGAFFDIDMMPKALTKTFEILPFNIISKSYYQSIVGNYSVDKNIILYVVISLVIMPITYKVLEKKMS